MPEETYTTKEILNQYRIQLDRIESKIDGIAAQKADKVEVERLVVRFEVLEKNGSSAAARALEIAQTNRSRIEKLEGAAADVTASPAGREVMKAIEGIPVYEGRIKSLEDARIALWAFGIGILLNLGLNISQFLGWLKP